MWEQIIFGAALYAVFSCTEYAVHRYLMHGSDNALADNHWTHHEHTMGDMQLRHSEKYNSHVNKYLGLYFTWTYTCIIFTVGLAEAFVLRYALFGIVSPRAVVLWVAAFSVYQSSFWNTLHPDIHGIKEPIGWSDGVPGSEVWRELFSAISFGDDEKGEQRYNAYEWLKKNHVKHHAVKGADKGHYNVTLPGADWVFGTM